VHINEASLLTVFSSNSSNSNNSNNNSSSSNHSGNRNSSSISSGGDGSRSSMDCVLTSRLLRYRRVWTISKASLLTSGGSTIVSCRIIPSAVSNTPIPCNYCCFFILIQSLLSNASIIIGYIYLPKLLGDIPISTELYVNQTSISVFPSTTNLTINTALVRRDALIALL